MNYGVKNEDNVLYCTDCNEPFLTIDRGNIYCPKCKASSWPLSPTLVAYCQMCKNPAWATATSSVASDGLPTSWAFYCGHCKSRVNWLFDKPANQALG